MHFRIFDLLFQIHFCIFQKNKVGEVMDIKKAKIFLKECMRQHGNNHNERYTPDQYRQTIGALREAFANAKQAYVALQPQGPLVIEHHPIIGKAHKVVGLKELDPATGKSFRIDTVGGGPIKNPEGIPMRFRLVARQNNQAGRAPTVAAFCNWDDRPAFKR